MLTGQYSYKECQLALYRTLIFSEGINGLLTKAMRKACPGIHNLACTPFASHSRQLILSRSPKAGTPASSVSVDVENLFDLDLEDFTSGI